MKAEKMLFRQIGALAIILLSVISVAAKEQALTINSCPVQDFAVTRTASGWSFSYNREFYDDATVPWGKELQLIPGGWKKHPTIGHINGYNGDITLKISAPGPISEFSVGAQLVNYADAEIRKGVISYSINGIDYSVIAEKEFGDATIAVSQKLITSNGLLWLRFSRIVGKNDSNGQSGNVVFKMVSFKLNGIDDVKNQETTAVAAISATEKEQPLTINNCPVQDFAVTRTESGWSFSYNREFYDDATVPWGKELQLIPGGWKKHPTIGHINGYNGDITLKISAPGPISEFSVGAQFVNYADAEVRKGAVSYSINGTDYSVVSEKEFGAGTTDISGSQKLATGNGLLWLRFSRILSKNDLNGQSGNVVFKMVSFKLNGINDAEKQTIPEEADIPEKTGLKSFFPTGVFWPWERTMPNADFAGKELWVFVEETMKTLHDNNCDTIWFVNIGPGEDARRLCGLAEKHQLKVLLNTDLLGYYYNGFDSFDSMENAARKTINYVGDCPALLGYVLKDEPLLCSLAHCNYFYKLMKRIDPARDSIVVAMNSQTQSFLEETEMPVICSDLYYFGADKSINIPNPAKISQQMFRLNVSGMNLVADKHGKNSWLMPQMFADVWGRHYRKGDKMVVEPGSYLHWRMPSDAEIRWQIWEAMRCGSKGILFYVLYPPIPLWASPDQVKSGTPEEQKVKEMDERAEVAASWKTQELTKTRLEFDSGEAALQPGGNPTPQMLVMGKAFAYLRKYSDLLNSRQKADFPVFFPADENTQAATFIVPNKQQLRYGVIVNDDLDKTRKIKVLLPLNIGAVKNLNDGKLLAVESENQSFKSCELELASGDGCLLEAEFVNGQPGMLLMHEDFSQLSQHKVKLSRNARIERFGVFGIEPFYGVKMTGDTTDPVFSIENLTNHMSADNTVFMNINSRKRQGVVYCMIDGNLNGAEVKAITAPDKTGEQTNVAHLAESNSGKLSDKSEIGIGEIIQTDKFHIPAVIPAGTTSLEIFVSNNVDRINDVIIWFAPEVK